MTRVGDSVFLTWANGPVFRLGRTMLRVTPLPGERESLLGGVPGPLRHHWLVERVWLRWLCGPHFLDAVDLRLDEPTLMLSLPNNRRRAWRVPPENVETVIRFIDEFRRRRERRSLHRPDDGRGRSLLPLVALFVVLVWVFRRLRSR